MHRLDVASLTLYCPSSDTMQLSTASRPTATVTFSIGPAKFGFASLPDWLDDASTGPVTRKK